MKITDLLSKESVLLNADVNDKEACLVKLVDLMDASGKISDKKSYLDAVYEREKEGTTGVGNGIAIPHGRCKGVKEPGLAAMTINGGVEYNALDSKLVDLAFLIAAPEGSGSMHLEILSKLATMLMDENFVADLKKAKTVEEFLKVIDDAEEKKDESGLESGLETGLESNTGHYVLAVTACPTGIAHTYMAAEAIEKAAKAKGYKVKVETRGSGGAKNILTEEEINSADGIIVAADTNVPMDRFDGKKVIECQVSKGINKPNELIDEIVSGNVAVYKSNSKKANNEAKDSAGHSIYKHLMNGVSHMLPFVVGGGILIALAFLVDGMNYDIDSLTDAQRASFGTLTPLANFLKGQVGGVAFGFMLPVLAGFIAMSIADRPGLAVGILGGSIAANGTSGFFRCFSSGFYCRLSCKSIKESF